MSEMNTVTMPENSAEDTLTETPTVLICSGDGGIKKGKATLSLAKREGIAERVKMIAINSGSGKFDGLDDDVETITLRTPEQRFHDHDKDQRHYLERSDNISGAHGAQRNRRIGRYYFDNPERIGSHHDQIRRTIVEFVERLQDDPNVDGPQAVNVFQLVGAGGGTGSGVMALVTGLLYNVLGELEEDLHPGFEQWAICSLASTENFDGGGDTPDVHWRYLANSLALLDELRALTGYDDVEYPLRIPLLSSKDRSNNRRSAYPIDENPFSGVFLLRYNQDEAGDRLYREGVGRTTARLVLEWMRKDQDQFAGLENEVEALTNTFFEVRGASFEAPNDRIQQLLDAKREHQSANETAERLQQELNDLETAIEQLDAALDADALLRGPTLVSTDAADQRDEDVETVPEVMVTAFKRAEQVASNISPRSARVDAIKNELAELQDRRSHTFHERVDGDTVQRAIFMSAVLAEASSALRNHRFDTLMHEFVDRHESTITDYDASFDPTANPKDQYLQTIEPMLDERIQMLSSELDGMGLTGRFTDREAYTSKKETLEQLRSTLKKLQRALNEHDQIEQLAEAIENERDADYEELNAQRVTLSTAKNDTKSELQTTRQRAKASHETVERYKETIQNAPLGRFVTLPVSSGAELKEDHFADDPGITSLIKDGVLDREMVVNRLQETLYDHEDGVLGAQLETRGKSRSPSQGRLVVFCTEETRELMWEEAPSGTPPKTIATDEFAKQPETVRCNDDHHIGMVAVYGGLSLDNFDHGHLRDSLFRGQAMLWGEPIDLKDCYAYPEILPTDHPVSMRSQVDNIDLSQWSEDDD